MVMFIYVPHPDASLQQLVWWMLNLHHDAHYHSLAVYPDNLECPLQGKIQ